MNQAHYQIKQILGAIGAGLFFSILIVLMGIGYSEVWFKRDSGRISITGVPNECLNAETFLDDMGLNSNDVWLNDRQVALEILPVENGPAPTKAFVDEVNQVFSGPNPRPRKWYKGVGVPYGFKRGWFYQRSCVNLYYGDHPFLITKAFKDKLILSNIRSMSLAGPVPEGKPILILERMDNPLEGLLKITQLIRYSSSVIREDMNEAEAHPIMVTRVISLAYGPRSAAR